MFAPSLTPQEGNWVGWMQVSKWRSQCTRQVTEYRWVYRHLVFPPRSTLGKDLTSLSAHGKGFCKFVHSDSLRWKNDRTNYKHSPYIMHFLHSCLFLKGTFRHSLLICKVTGCQSRWTQWFHLWKPLVFTPGLFHIASVFAATLQIFSEVT